MTNTIHIPTNDLTLRLNRLMSKELKRTIFKMVASSLVCVTAGLAPAYGFPHPGFAEAISIMGVGGAAFAYGQGIIRAARGDALLQRIKLAQLKR